MKIWNASLVVVLFASFLRAGTHNVFILGGDAADMPLPSMLSGIANDHPEVDHGYEMDIGIGAALETHWASPTTGNAKRTAGDARRDLTTGNYDVFVMTEQLPIRTRTASNVVNASPGSGTAHDFAGRYYDTAVAANPNAQVYVFETWPCRYSGVQCLDQNGADNDADDSVPWRLRIDSDRALWDGIVDKLNAQHQGRPALLIPGGRALGALYDAVNAGQVPGMTSFFDEIYGDQIHMNAGAGAYYMACVYFSTIYKRSPEGLTAVTSNQWGAPNAVPAQAAALQRIAWTAVCNDPRTGVSCTAAPPSGSLSAPSGASAVALSSSSIRVSWTGNAGAGNGFRVERSRDNVSFSVAGVVGPETTQYTDQGLTASLPHYYRVSAYRKGGGSTAPTPVVSAVTLAAGSDLVRPAGPSGVTVTALSESLLQVSFTDNADNERWFRVERSGDGGVTFTTAAVLAPNVTRLVNGGLSPSTSYTYRVVAVGYAAESSVAMGTGSTRPGGTPPGTPTDFAATALSSQTVSLSWSPANWGGARSGFKIERSFDGTVYSQIHIVGAGATSFITGAGPNNDPALQPDTTYYYRVRAFSGSGDSAYASDSAWTLPVGMVFASFHPLTDVSAPPYLGQFPLGLYAGGNTMPAAHAAAGAAFAAQVVPRDVNGNPDPNGKIIVTSIGMSNNFMEFCRSFDEQTCDPGTFLSRAAADPAVRPLFPQVPAASLYILNGASPTVVADQWESPSAPPYARIQAKLNAVAGLSAAQVQVVWLKNADATPTTSLPAANADAYVYEQRTGNIVRTLKGLYPNLKLVFLSSRIYAGYAAVATDQSRARLNPEPYAYESGFSLKWLIDAQVNQMAGGPVDARAGNLNYDDGTAPWLAWGPYIWADGLTPNPDAGGLFYAPGDVDAVDGTHPSHAGGAKVGAALLDFFKTSPFTRSWFLARPPAVDVLPPARPRRLRSP